MTDYKCKRCDFVTTDLDELMLHLDGHDAEDKPVKKEIDIRNRIYEEVQDYMESVSFPEGNWKSIILSLIWSGKKSQDTPQEVGDKEEKSKSCPVCLGVGKLSIPYYNRIMEQLKAEPDHGVSVVWAEAEGWIEPDCPECGKKMIHTPPGKGDYGDVGHWLCLDCNVRNWPEGYTPIDCPVCYYDAEPEANDQGAGTTESPTTDKEKELKRGDRVKHTTSLIGGIFLRHCENGFAEVDWDDGSGTMLGTDLIEKESPSVEEPPQEKEGDE